MLDTADPITYQLAVLIGALSVAAGIGGWRRPDDWRKMFEEFDTSPGLMMAMAMIAILFGALILLLPGGWSDPLAIAVSGVGLISLGEGLMLLAVPHDYVRLVTRLLRHARVWAGFSILFGLAFLAGGLPGMLLR